MGSIEDLSCGESWETPWRKVWATGSALEIFSKFPSQTDLILLKSEIQNHINGCGTSSSWDALEETTTAILRSMGYDARVTAKSKDGGIDVIVEHAKYGTIYTQVKHSKNKVGVRVLRELIGTMILGGSRSALLVTSSGFTQGVRKEKKIAECKGLLIELVDGEHFLSALKLSTRSQAPKLDEIRNIANPNILLIEEQIQI
jgi:predicted Mrr-cat superfamily restriction endonuclease